MAADLDLYRALASRAAGGERAELARSLPARKEVLMKLHELDRRRHGLFLAVQLEYCVTTDDFLGFDEWTIENAELAVNDSHLRALGNRHQPTIVEHASCLDLPVGEFVHRLQEGRSRGDSVSGLDDEHEFHMTKPPEASRVHQRR